MGTGAAPSSMYRMGDGCIRDSARTPRRWATSVIVPVRYSMGG